MSERKEGRKENQRGGSQFTEQKPGFPKYDLRVKKKKVRRR